MSTAWGLYCEDCDSASEQPFNHGEEVLSDLVGLFPFVHGIMHYKKQSWYDYCLGCESEVHRVAFKAINVWLDAHYGHDLRLYTEYKDKELIKGYVPNKELSSLEEMAVLRSKATKLVSALSNIEQLMRISLERMK